jgi:hypothetical protein
MYSYRYRYSTRGITHGVRGIDLFEGPFGNPGAVTTLERGVSDELIFLLF